MTCIGLHDFTPSLATKLPFRTKVEAVSCPAYLPGMISSVSEMNFKVLYSQENYFYQAVKKQRVHRVIPEINNLFDICSTANWDGYGAKPVCKTLRTTVEQFINALPENIPDPEISVDPDGEISLDWCLTSDRMFSVSIGKKRKLSYAGICGLNKSNGLDYLGREIPQSILVHLYNLLK